VGGHWHGSDALFARIATAVFQALYEHNLTLVEALKILEVSGHEFRAALARSTKDEATRGTLEALNTLRPSDYQAQVGSTNNRFQRLLRNVSLRAASARPRCRLISDRRFAKGASSWYRLPQKAARFPRRTPAPLSPSCLWICGPPLKSAAKGLTPPGKAQAL
jgi:hypothetical protein